MPGLFNVIDEDLHRVLKKPIASIYSMSNLVSFEPYVDSTMSVFFEELDRRFVQTNKVCEFDAWLQMFAFDVMGEITFSKRLGFLEKGEDVDGIMASIWKHFQYTAPVSKRSLNLPVLTSNLGWTNALARPFFEEKSHIITSKARSNESDGSIRASSHERAARR